MNCFQCGHQLSDGMNFCSQCGANLKTSHEDQQARTEQTAAPAPTPVTEDPSLITRYLTPQLSHKILATRGRIEGERRQVTALFVDIKGYTSLSETIGEEAIYRLMERMYEVMITAVYQEEGSVQKLTGDGIFALFGAPVALEDAPLRACRAGLAIQHKMKVLGDELMKEQNIRPLARIGIHTGPVVIGTVGTDMRMEFTALGDTVNLASRMESIAEPGTVYISEATYTLAGPYIESTFVGEKQVKGKTEPQKVYRVDNLKAHAVRFDVSLKRGLTPLVGRTEELNTLERYLSDVVSGKTILVQLVGGPGVGKSRVMHEFHKRLSERQIYYLRANCMSYGQTTSFLPFIDLLKDLMNINDSDNQETAEIKLLNGLVNLGMEATAKPFLLNLLSYPVKGDSLKGLDARIIGDRTREVLVTLFLNRSHQGPIVLAIEDIHWIDPASEELMQRITTKETGLPLMLLCTTRPTYKTPWLDSSKFKVIQLESLSKDSAKQMVSAILGSEHVADDINAMIIEKAGGNPFFTEEMTRYLIESKNLKKTEKTVSYELASDKMTVPTTILDLLQARVDRLDDELKTILQTAAVVGQRFSPELVRQVSGINGKFGHHLKELEKQDLIFPERVGNVLEYRFKHALLQDVIYDNLLKPRREKLHQTVAETLERIYPERLKELAEALAHHWEHTASVEKTVRYLVISGEKSVRMYAMDQAHQLFMRAVKLIASAPGCLDDTYLAEVLNKWALVFVYRADYKGMLNTLGPYRARMEALSDKRQVSIYLSWLGTGHSVSGRWKTGRPLLEQALTLAGETGDPSCIGITACWLAFDASYWSPDNGVGDAMLNKYVEMALEKAEKLDDVYIMQNAYRAYAVHSLVHSRFSDARACCSKVMAMGEKFHDNRSLSMAQWIMALCCLLEDRYDESLEHSAGSLRFSPDLHDEQIALEARGGALALKGQVREGLDIMRKVRNSLIEHDFILPRAGVDIPLGAVMVLAGRMAEGINHIHHMIKQWASLGNYVQPVWGHVFLGEIYLQIALGAPPPLPVILKNFWFVLTNKPVAKRKAKYHFGEVVRKSREYNMPGFLAKALYGLGVLAQSKKYHLEARTHFEEALKVAEENDLYIAEKVRTALKNIRS